jgi:hemerythrin-like domain-containing protein
MTTQVLELEGTWEEILAQAAKFADRRVRIIVLAEEPLKSAEDCFRQGWHEAMTGETVPLSELWEGIDPVIEMMESLPENLQQQVAEYLKEYIAELKDELQWDESFEKTQPQLVAAAQRAKKEIAEGKAQKMKLNEL